MFALLSFLYDLPYTTDPTEDWDTSLEPHALVYVVADKYQLGSLREAVAENMQKVITDKAYTHTAGFLRYCNSFKNSDDFFSALETILEYTTPQDNQARKVLIDFIIQNIDFFRKQSELLSLFEGNPELAIEIISHQDLESEAEGFWMCEDENCGTNIPSCGSKCKFMFEPHFLRRYRYDEQWKCPVCKFVGQPHCVDCRTKISWVPESACNLDEQESGNGKENAMDVDVASGAATKASRWHAGR